jgi:hypothetical protein
MVNLIEVPKRCRICGEEKAESEFPTDKHDSRCKICKNRASRQYYSRCDKEKLSKKQAEYYQRNREHKLEVGRAYHSKNREKRNQQSKKWNAEHAAWRREYDSRKQYGLTLDVERELLAKQDYKCATCRRPFEGNRSRKLCRDHHHKLGHFRGFLCDTCNQLEGRAKSTGNPIKTLKNMIKRFESEVLFNAR